ncbi:MAG: serine/threonine-protein kinase [Kofleriaceae bacterium]
MLTSRELNPRYRIRRRLGQGGMAEVFEGELAGDHNFVRKVALKRLLPAVADDVDAAKRFLDEARIASALHHANIVGVLDVGLLDGVPFQVLELVDGLDAAAVMRRCGGTVPVPVALAIAGEVARALDHAHHAVDEGGLAREIVHRDVKPQNILISWDGDVKLTDFGIALARDREARTEIGQVAGTVGFMAPEQRTGQVVDGASDVYALGLTLHALITGESAITKPEHEVMAASGQRVPLAETLPEDARGVIERAIAPQRPARPTAAQLADDIERVLALRSAGNPKTIVRDLVAPLKPQTARRGALDALLGLEVVEASHADGELPRFELRQTAKEPTEPVPVPKGKRPWLAVIAIVLVGFAGVRVWRFVHRREVAAATDARGSGFDGRGQDDAGLVVDSPARIDAAIADVPHVDAGMPRADAGHHHATAMAHPDAGVAAPVGTGYLQVVGENVVGASVLVDGVVRGYPPNSFVVPRGHHSIAIQFKDGTKSAPRSIDITDLDTLAHPRKIEW